MGQRRRCRNPQQLSPTIRSFDLWQQRSRSVGFVVGVVKKFADDRGGQLASLIAFSAFLSFFPLMLVVVTITAFVGHRYPIVAERLRSSAVAEFPVVGADLTNGQGSLPGDGLGLVIGLAGLAWGGVGFTQAVQHTFHEVWHVARKSRPSFWLRLKRGVIVVALLAGSVIGSTTLSLLGSILGNSGLATLLGHVGALLMSGGIFLAVFRLLSPREVTLGELLPGVVVATVGWQALQSLGVLLVGHQLRRSSNLYGAIGAALGLMWFLFVSAQILVLALEVAVVRKERLWPRSLFGTPLTESDVSVLSLLAKIEERRPDEQISVRFDE